MTTDARLHQNLSLRNRSAFAITETDETLALVPETGFESVRRRNCGVLVQIWTGGGSTLFVT